MKTIDFSPSVFDSDKPEPPDAPERSPSNWRPRVTFLVALLLTVAAIVFAIVMMTGRPHYQPEAPSLSVPYASADVASRITAMPPGVVSTSAPGYCTGNEVICTVATASKPADLLRKIVASIPAATAKQYRVRLSVTAIEEPVPDNSDSRTP